MGSQTVLEGSGIILIPNILLSAIFVLLLCVRCSVRCTGVEVFVHFIVIFDLYFCLNLKFTSYLLSPSL